MNISFIKEASKLLSKIFSETESGLLSVELLKPQLKVSQEQEDIGQMIAAVEVNEYWPSSQSVCEEVIKRKTSLWTAPLLPGGSSPSLSTCQEKKALNYFL